MSSYEEEDSIRDEAVNLLRQSHRSSASSNATPVVHHQARFRKLIGFAVLSFVVVLAFAAGAHHDSIKTSIQSVYAPPATNKAKQALGRTHATTHLACGRGQSSVDVPQGHTSSDGRIPTVVLIALNTTEDLLSEPSERTFISRNRSGLSLIDQPDKPLSVDFADDAACQAHYIPSIDTDAAALKATVQPDEVMLCLATQPHRVETFLNVWAASLPPASSVDVALSAVDHTSNGTLAQGPTPRILILKQPIAVPSEGWDSDLTDEPFEDDGVELEELAQADESPFQEAHKRQNRQDVIGNRTLALASRIGLDLVYNDQLADRYEERFFQLVLRAWENDEQDRARGHGKKWFILLDDDTAIINFSGLLSILSQYDPAEKHFVGGLSESKEALHGWGVFGYGGAGIALSQAMVEAMNKPDIAAECLSRGKTIFGGDGIVAACAEYMIGKPITSFMQVESTMRQMDFGPDNTGYFEAGLAITTLHHWLAWFSIWQDTEHYRRDRLQSVLLMLSTARQLGGHNWGRRYLFDENRTMITLGYSVTLYKEPLTASDLEKIEWTWAPDRELYDPVRPPLEATDKSSYLLTMIKQIRDPSFALPSLLMRHHNQLGEMIQVIWQPTTEAFKLHTAEARLQCLGDCDMNNRTVWQQTSDHAFVLISAIR
ncbi:hypothetical protein E5Q_04067 [Mixia osmundae IAM 14324]|uniref:Fringe-like glycosyltransferase domain-containing protein n=1 Tax=Mixia osmundae (strain CBS 9802 / IAM 14324 / JCM 22182 / KY 12970) TaxID=764103 RepID=G7E3H9_MIXOS|nr:hypothetical protein E5Q_04067 [Mixia osmundae IAM 14324]